MSESDYTRKRALEVVSVWWVFVVVGIASLVAGVILVLKPSNSLATLAVVFGIFLLVDGIAELISSFERGAQNRGLAAIVGVLAIIIGIALIRHPLHGVAAIGLVIGIWLVAAGVIRLVAAFAVSSHRLLSVVIALIEIVAGIVIVSDPHIGYSALAIIAGIWLILNGIGMTALGFAVHGAKSELSATPQVAGNGSG